jgi:tRNA/rRNA methyltransferase
MKQSLSLSSQVDLRLVMVRPIYERNVGAASRAMSNMGYDKMILIDPQCEFTIEAQKAAATGQSAFQKKTIYSSWEEFWKNEPSDGLRISMTARDGRGRAARPFDETLEWIAQNSPHFNTGSKKSDSEDLGLSDSNRLVTLHLFFGPEDWGLNAEDIKDSHFCCVIPTYGPNSSLNLAQAVLVTLFMLRQAWGGEKTKLDGQQAPRETTEKIIFPEQSLKQWLMAMNIDISSKKINAFTVLRRMLLQNTPTPKELRILETVLQQSIRRMTKERDQSP